MNHLQHFADSFHAGESATCNNKSQKPTLQLRVFCYIRMFQTLDDMITQFVGVSEIAHAEAVFAEARCASQVCFLANGDDKVIVLGS